MKSKPAGLSQESSFVGPDAVGRSLGEGGALRLPGCTAPSPESELLSYIPLTQVADDTPALMQADEDSETQQQFRDSITQY